MARLARGEAPVDVVVDQRGSPTWTHDLAVGVRDLVERRPDPGVYHATNDGETTWHGFAQRIFRAVGAAPERVRPVPTSGFPRPAPRPAYSVLSGGRWRAAGLPALRPWHEAFDAAVRDEGDRLLR
jgi:dTDP-4-dehydrorhamnose reductase